MIKPPSNKNLIYCCLSDSTSSSLNLFRCQQSKPRTLWFDQMRSKSKQVLLLWLEGFREACSLHRVVILCLRFLSQTDSFPNDNWQT